MISGNLHHEHQRLLRAMLPYGVWTLEDGSEVLFDRDYKPRWIRRPGEKATTVDNPDWRVPAVSQRWFYDDGCSPWNGATVARRRGAEEAFQRCRTALDDFLHGRPLQVWDESELTLATALRRAEDLGVRVRIVRGGIRLTNGERLGKKYKEVLVHHLDDLRRLLEDDAA